MTKNSSKPEKVKFKKTVPTFTKERFRKFMLGTKDSMGFVKSTLAYIILLSIGFVFMYPLLKMLSTSFMSLNDLLNTSINWLPSKLYTTNYKAAAKALNYAKSLKDSIILAGVPTLIQVCIAAFVGYGFARFDFKGKKICMALLIFAFVLPAQIMTTPTYMLYNQMNLTGSIWAFVVPAALGQGIKAPIFILITMTFYKQVPQSLIEAAHMDGAGYLKSFFKIAIPSATGALIVVLLFSFVWYWNETYLTRLYITTGVGKRVSYRWDTLIVGLGKFDSLYNENESLTTTSTTANINESYRMAGTILAILPLLVLYAVMQRYFVESIDRVGITGE